MRLFLLIISWLSLSVSTSFGQMSPSPTTFSSSLAWFDTDDASRLPLKVSRGTEWNAKRVNSRNLVQASPEPQPTYLANAINGLALPSFDAEYMPISREPADYRHGSVGTLSFTSGSLTAATSGNIAITPPPRPPKNAHPSPPAEQASPK